MLLKIIVTTLFGGAGVVVLALGLLSLRTSTQQAVSFIVPGLILLAAGLALPAISWFNESTRKRAIAKHSDWPDELRQKVLLKRVAPAMTPEMVMLAWGNPRRIEKENSSSGVIERWTYGTPGPRRPASYVWFEGGRVTKTKT